MALFYGSYFTVIDSFRPKGIICPDCGAKDQIVVEKTIGVIHIMFVPILPNYISTSFTCTSCAFEFTIEDLNSETKEYLKQFKSKKRIPIWFFTGPIILLFIAGYFAFMQNANENEMLMRLQMGIKNNLLNTKQMMANILQCVH